MDRKTNFNLLEEILKSQKNEITEYHVYRKLSQNIKDKKNSELLLKIANEELSHYNFWRKYTNENINPGSLKIFFYFIVSKLLGLTFGLKLMERVEEGAQINYSAITEHVPEAQGILEDEKRHEDELLSLIDEERLNYVGSMVLGLNDALVELTGTLAGLTFALQNTKLIALAGLITGIAASLSMAVSEYLSTKSDGSGNNALKSSVYTGIAYIMTVFLLILPYFILSNYLLCLASTIIVAIAIIFVFNFYISIAKDLDFKKRFLEMTFLSLGVASLTFIIGAGIKKFIGIEI